MTRAPMPDYYARRVILAELARADRYGRYVDCNYLRYETGLWDRLERHLRAARRERGRARSAAVTSLRSAEGGAKDKDGHSPTLAVRSRSLCAPHNWSLAVETDRRLDLDYRLAKPSDLIATINAEWPAQAQAVRDYADRHGLKLGEAWATLIETAVDRLREDVR